MKPKVSNKHILPLSLIIPGNIFSVLKIHKFSSLWRICFCIKETKSAQQKCLFFFSNYPWKYNFCTKNPNNQKHLACLMNLRLYLAQETVCPPTSCFTFPALVLARLQIANTWNFNFRGLIMTLNLEQLRSLGVGSPNRVPSVQFIKYIINCWAWASFGVLLGRWWMFWWLEFEL